MVDNCKDINGDDISQFLFGEDGVVYGIVVYQDTQTSYNITLPYNGEGMLVNLSLECCTALGQTYNSDYGKCYHRDINNSDLKIVFNVDNYNGYIFTQQPTEKCSLNLKFDYLVEYVSDDIFNGYQNFGNKISDTLKGLKMSLLIEKNVFKPLDDNGIIFEDTKSLVKVYEQDIYDIKSFGEPSGIILTGSKKTIIQNILQSELGDSYYAEILDSPWLHTNVIISDEVAIQEILNEEIKFSILITNSDIDFSLIMDNVLMDKVCTRDWIETRSIDSAPSFNVTKVRDNKKSWVSGQLQRDHNLPIRETSYGITDERMVINSKEVEISTSIFDAIEQDMATFIIENTGLLQGTEDSGDYRDLDVTNIMSSDVLGLASNQLILKAMATELVDVKSRKVLVNYPLLGLVYDRYLNSEIYLNGVVSNKYSPSKLNGLVNMLGGYWADLIEQVVPSTTIWSSINRIGTTTFTPNKFRYSRYNIICGDPDWGIVTDMDGNNVEIITSDITQNSPELQICNNIQIANFSDDGATIGSVSITGTDGTTNLTTINEE